MLEGIFLWVFTLIGMVYLTCDAEILNNLRLQFRALHPLVDRALNCRICTSFWMSFPASIMLTVFYALTEPWQVLFGVFVMGPFAALGVSTILNVLSPMAAFKEFSKRLDGKK